MTTTRTVDIARLAEVRDMMQTALDAFDNEHFGYSIANAYTAARELSAAIGDDENEWLDGVDHVAR